MTKKKNGGWSRRTVASRAWTYGYMHINGWGCKAGSDHKIEITQSDLIKLYAVAWHAAKRAKPIRS